MSVAPKTAVRKHGWPDFFGETISEVRRFWKGVALRERRRANVLEQALQMVAPEHRVEADVFLGRASKLMEDT